MIEREEVLHVARLARLRLADDEVERMRAEMSSILDHIDRIAGLDLEDTEPTARVIDVENVLRADVPHTSLPHEVALASAPDPVQGSFRVPSPQSDSGE